MSENYATIATAEDEIIGYECKYCLWDTLLNQIVAEQDILKQKIIVFVESVRKDV